VNIPDYVSPIVAYRVWRLGRSGLTSLSRGERWPTGHALTARCNRVAGLCVGSHNNGHQAPQESCTCGIYAVKSLGQLRRMRYAAFAICREPYLWGEVYLWGVVVEHKLGWRAQFAYPKNLVVPFEMIPVDEMEAQSHLAALVAYGVDIFIHDGKWQLPLWEKGSGYAPDYMRLLTSPRGGTPPGSAGPPRLPPPPAVPVHSSWDISRILQCTRHHWPEQWTLAAAS
jgi:hypothetical protein